MKTIAILLALGLPAAAWAQADGKRIDQLIADLGSEEFGVRETADKELRKIGEAAVPALKKAVEGGDAERADRARKILDHIAKAKKSPAPTPRGIPQGTQQLSSSFIYRNLGTGVTFKQDTDGKVEITVPEDDDKSGRKVYRTYTADSFDAFKAEHPDIVKKFDLDSISVPRMWTFGGKDLGGIPGQPLPPIRPMPPIPPFGQGWAEPPDPLDPDAFEKWLQEQMKQIEELRKRLKLLEPDRDPAPTPVPTVPQPQQAEKSVEFGIKIDVVNETLRSQLDLAEGAGVQVEFVKEGSIAEKAGVKLHDIIVSLRGKAVNDKWEFRRALKEALGTESFEIEAIRGGAKQKLVVKPGKKD